MVDRLTWRGRPVDELTREELIAALHNLHERLEERDRWAREDREMETLFDDTRRLLRRR